MQEIEVDVRLIAANCRYFNAAHTAYAAAATSLEAQFDALWPPTVTDLGTRAHAIHPARPPRSRFTPFGVCSRATAHPYRDRPRHPARAASGGVRRARAVYQTAVAQGRAPCVPKCRPATSVPRLMLRPIGCPRSTCAGRACLEPGQLKLTGFVLPPKPDPDAASAATSSEQVYRVRASERQE